MGTLLEPDEAAKRLSVTRRTLDRWRTERQGPPYKKLGKAHNAPVRYDTDDLAAWVASTTVDPEGGETAAG